MTVSQAAFRAALLDPAAAIPENLTDPLGRPAGARFDVYRNNVVASLSEALGTGFPVIQKLLGAQNFRSLAVSYSRAHPPRSPLMMHMGGDLPAFLEGFEPLQRFGYLADVARLELALRESYHAADLAPVPPDALATLPPEVLEGARLRIAPAVRLVASPWPIVSIWRFNMANGPKPAAVAEAALILRPEYDPEIHSISHGTHAFVAALIAGATLGAAAASGAEVRGDFGPAPALSALFAGGAVTHIDTRKDPSQ